MSLFQTIAVWPFMNSHVVGEVFKCLRVSFTAIGNRVSLVLIFYKGICYNVKMGY